jgi:hypothetical protein
VRREVVKGEGVRREDVKREGVRRVLEEVGYAGEDEAMAAA